MACGSSSVKVEAGRLLLGAGQRQLLWASCGESLRSRLSLLGDSSFVTVLEGFALILVYK